MSITDLIFWEIVLAGALRLATPIAFAALGESIVERSGTINVGVDGIMVAGAFAGVYGANQGGWATGVLLAAAVGAVLGLVMAVAVLWGGVDQIVTGIALALLGTGLTSYLFQVWQPSGRSAVLIPLAPTIRIPGLKDIPLVGEALFAQNLLTYVCVVLVIAAAWALRRTRAGLAVRAAGDDPSAAHVRGIRVRAVRTSSLAVGGALAGIGGASITVGYLGSFSDGITAGRGFIALAVVIIGRWTPIGAALGALLFAGFDSLALQAQGGTIKGLPVEAYSALPYTVTLVVLVATARHQRAPRSLGRPLAADR